jgi:hypothetical protein
MIEISGAITEACALCPAAPRGACRAFSSLSFRPFGLPHNPPGPKRRNDTSSTSSNVRKRNPQWRVRSVNSALIPVRQTTVFWCTSPGLQLASGRLTHLPYLLVLHRQHNLEVAPTMRLPTYALRMPDRHSTFSLRRSAHCDTRHTRARTLRLASRDCRR